MFLLGKHREDTQGLRGGRAGRGRRWQGAVGRRDEEGSLKEGYVWRIGGEGGRVKGQRKGKSKMGQDNAVSGMIH